jgi:hypothetical protein
MTIHEPAAATHPKNSEDLESEVVLPKVHDAMIISRIIRDITDAWNFTQACIFV